MLKISPSYLVEMEEGYCVDTVIHADENTAEKVSRLSQYEESVVIIPHKDYLKVHLHTDNSRLWDNRNRNRDNPHRMGSGILRNLYGCSGAAR